MSVCAAACHEGLVAAALGYLSVRNDKYLIRISYGPQPVRDDEQGLVPAQLGDHIIPKLVHAKLIRTHTVAGGSDSCDYWYVADESDTAKNFKGTLV